MDISQTLGLKSIILDTETHTLEGVPVEVAYGACEIQSGGLCFDKQHVFDQYYSIGDFKIALGAMAVHHIIESDLVDKPNFTSFQLPADVEYIIGHNIKYDIAAISRCGMSTDKYKQICTLAMARYLWPELESHKLGLLSYFVLGGTAEVRDFIQNAHCASVDIELTALVLDRIIQEAEIKSIEQLYEFSQQASIMRKIYFGKHRGDNIADLPVSYVQWLLKQPDLAPELKEGIYTYHPNYATAKN